MGTLKSRVTIIFKKIPAYYHELKLYYNSKSRLCYIGVMALIMIPPLVLALFQFAILYIIPPEFTLDYLHLDYSQPNISSMFFSAYVHNISSFEHLLGNYAGYVAVIVLILVFFFVIIPLMKLHNVLSLKYSDNPLFLTSVIFFFVLPFSLAGISIAFGKMVNQQGTWGFSGILWAFTAYFIFLLLEMVYDAVLTKSLLNANSEKRTEGNPDTTDKFSKGVLLLALLSIVFISAPVFVILLDMGNEKINVFAHLGGFILGFLVSVMVALVCESNQKRVKNICIVSLALILLIPAVMWMVV
jgi:hypothetical protein